MAELLATTRNPWPKSVVWVQTDDVLKHCYWVEALRPVDKGRIEASVSGNTIKLKTEGQHGLALWLAPGFVDLSKPVTVEVSGGKPRTFTPKPTLGTFCLGLEERGDPRLAAGVRVEVE